MRREAPHNVGPDDIDCLSTGRLVSLFCEKWGDVKWIDVSEENAPHEANFLKLDSSKIKTVFGWTPRWTIETTMDKIVEWNKIYLQGLDAEEITNNQIKEFFNYQM